MKRSFIALAALALAGTVALPVMASTLDDTPEKTISIAGIDMTTDAGAEIVYKRIVKAADRVCGVNHGRMTLKGMKAAETCAENAVKAAVTVLGAEKVTTLHAVG